MRSCIFCSARVNSREHAWPAWLLGLGVARGQPFNIYHRDDSGPIKDWDGVGLKSGRHLRTRRVCLTCNTGWMHTLKTAAKRVLGPLMTIADLAIPLLEEDQRLIALWAAKTAMVFESLGARDNFYKQPDRELLRVTLSPPLTAMVWIGRLQRAEALTAWSTHDLYRPNAEGVVFTLTLGRLLIQLFDLRPKPEVVANYSHVGVQPRPGPWERGLAWIRPYQGAFSWPPVHSIADADLEPLHQRFGGRPMRGPAPKLRL